MDVYTEKFTYPLISQSSLPGSLRFKVPVRGNYNGPQGTHGIRGIRQLSIHRQRDCANYVRQNGYQTVLYKIPRPNVNPIDPSFPRGGNILRVIEQLDEESEQRAVPIPLTVTVPEVVKPVVAVMEPVQRNMDGLVVSSATATAALPTEMEDVRKPKRRLSTDDAEPASSKRMKPTVEQEPPQPPPPAPAVRTKRKMSSAEEPVAKAARQTGPERAKRTAKDVPDSEPIAKRTRTQDPERNKRKAAEKADEPAPKKSKK